MSRQQHSSLASSLVASVLGSQPVIALPTPFIHLLGDCTAATFLAQCCYLSNESTNADGWFERSHEVWKTELGLSPEQVRRCVRDCTGMVEVKRMGLPSRNFYRVLPEGIKSRLAKLAIPEVTRQAVGAGAQVVTSQPKSRQAVANPHQSPVAQQTPQQAVEQTPRHSSSLEVKKKNTQRDDVQLTAPISTEMLTRLLGSWNTNRGDLPEASGLSTPRRKALTVLLADCGGNIEQATTLLTDATREVAADDFWKAKKFGLDTLLPKVLGKAEAYRSRQARTSPKATAWLPEFGVGQYVLYRRERYAIETITDRYIDLWDDENGSARILINSDDIRAVKPLEVRA